MKTISYLCKICFNTKHKKIIFYDRKQARNHIAEQHKLETKDRNKGKSPGNKRKGLMNYIERDEY